MMAWQDHRLLRLTEFGGHPISSCNQLFVTAIIFEGNTFLPKQLKKINTFYHFFFNVNSGGTMKAPGKTGIKQGVKESYISGNCCDSIFTLDFFITPMLSTIE
jgi:hypothetical protein